MTQGVLSKELATIKLDCPIELSFEDAKFNDIFTGEAYQLLKQLEFKSVLKKFDGEHGEEFSVNLKKVFELDEADQIFSRAKNVRRQGLQSIMSRKIRFLGCV